MNQSLRLIIRSENTNTLKTLKTLLQHQPYMTEVVLVEGELEYIFKDMPRLKQAWKIILQTIQAHSTIQDEINEISRFNPHYKEPGTIETQDEDENDCEDCGYPYDECEC